MIAFDVVKYLHILTALVSILLFLYRAKLQLQGKSIPPVLRFFPHVNDSLLFVLGVIMLYLAQLNILQMPWLQLKFVLIVLYILFGMYSFKWATSYQQQKFGIWMALLTFIAIILVAVNKQLTL